MEITVDDGSTEPVCTVEETHAVIGQEDVVQPEAVPRKTRSMTARDAGAVLISVRTDGASSPRKPDKQLSPTSPLTGSTGPTLMLEENTARESETGKEKEDEEVKMVPPRPRPELYPSTALSTNPAGVIASRTRSATNIMYFCPFQNCDYSTDLQGMQTGPAARHGLNVHNHQPWALKVRGLRFVEVLMYQNIGTDKGASGEEGDCEELMDNGEGSEDEEDEEDFSLYLEEESVGDGTEGENEGEGEGRHLGGQGVQADVGKGNEEDVGKGERGNGNRELGGILSEPDVKIVEEESKTDKVEEGGALEDAEVKAAVHMAEVQISSHILVLIYE